MFKLSRFNVAVAQCCRSSESIYRPPLVHLRKAERIGDQPYGQNRRLPSTLLLTVGII
jgi:hypothetical protein